MEIWFKRKWKISYSFVFIIGLVFLLFNIFYKINSIPDTMTIFAGEKTEVLAPFTADFQPETVSVLNVSNYGDSQIIDNDIKTSKIKLGFKGVPIKDVNVNILPYKTLIPCGDTVGIKIHSNGIMVLGIGYVNNSEGKAVKPSENILQAGDLIMEAAGVSMGTKEDLMQVIAQNNSIHMKISRDGQIFEADLTPVKSLESGENKLGVWVRDSTQGIGTITYLNPNTSNFGSLGHGIVDVDTKDLININYGDVLLSSITHVNKGEKGTPGELVGDIKTDVVGNVKLNTKNGVYGTYSEEYKNMLAMEEMEIGLKEEIVKGPAKILCNINGEEIKAYDIYIEEINFRGDINKKMVIKITDKDLLSKTNGIVQGMSGSPIIQNNKIIGAVTHVFVQDPTKGYGIFIENMLEEENKMG